MSQDFASLNWQPGFYELGSQFLTVLKPTPLNDLAWGAISEEVAQMIGLAQDWQTDLFNLDLLSGNTSLEQVPSYATVYSGHQFGVWAGQLGDGRAIHLGTVKSQQQLWEIQLKGAGKTPYSRMGDGRAVLRSSIREFLCSEAMAGLGVPTTRALALTHSSAKVIRESVETAAVVTRVAPSFIRFGHFEHFASQQKNQELKLLTDFVIANYFKHLKNHSNIYWAFFEEVIDCNAKLVAKWQSLGFCHGVLNTDNMSILGLTMDYGPFAFMDTFNIKYICNHSDSSGRYAFLNQPSVFHWNLVRLAEALLPILAVDESESEIELTIEKLKELLSHFPKIYEAAYQNEMQLKLGLSAHHPELIQELILLLDENRIDYTYFFRNLCEFVNHPKESTINLLKDLFLDVTGFITWLDKYQNALPKSDPTLIASSMRSHNPKYILRQYLAEQVIQSAQQGDFAPLHRLHQCLKNPFDEQEEYTDLASLPPQWAAHIEVSCSS